MKNLLVITHKVNENDDLMGFFIDWLREFSKYFDQIFVIAHSVGKYNLPSNVKVYSLNKDMGASRIKRAIKFYLYLFKLVPRSSIIFAHMSPIFVIASWPVAFMYRKRIILWYLHRSVTLRLKLAEKLSYKIVTAARESLKLKSAKIVETGHGINIDKFSTDRNWTESKLKIISVGRISRIKNYETLLKAAKIWKDSSVDFEIKIIGQPMMGEDFAYFESLKSMRESLGLGNLVKFLEFVPHVKMPAYYKQSDIAIGLTPDGGIDKTILEAMASGCLVLTSNGINRKYFGDYGNELIFDYRDPVNLAEKIIALKNSSHDNKKSISDFLIKSVSANHRLENVINRISSLV